MLDACNVTIRKRLRSPVIVVHRDKLRPYESNNGMTGATTSGNGRDIAQGPDGIVPPTPMDLGGTMVTETCSEGEYQNGIGRCLPDLSTVSNQLT